MNESHAKPPSPRLVIVCGLVAAIIIGSFVLVPCTLNGVGARVALGRYISVWIQVNSAVRVYHMERGHYPASLEEPDFQPYLTEHVVAFLHEGRLAYLLPMADSPPTFIIILMTTPRGDYSFQLDGEVSLRRRGAGDEAQLQESGRSQVKLGNEGA